jgi:hypothetical protein
MSNLWKFLWHIGTLKITYEGTYFSSVGEPILYLFACQASQPFEIFLILMLGIWIIQMWYEPTLKLIYLASGKVRHPNVFSVLYHRHLKSSRVLGIIIMNNILLRIFTLLNRNHPMTVIRRLFFPFQGIHWVKIFTLSVRRWIAWDSVCSLILSIGIGWNRRGF